MSCSDAASAKKVCDELAALDRAANRIASRSVIAWEGEVKVFENGRIEGAGACKEYRAGVTTAQDITTSAPRGSGAVASGKKVTLGWSGVFPRIKNKNPQLSTDGWLMGRYVEGNLEVVGNTQVGQTWDFIMTTNGEILIGRKHTWLSQGDDVLAAGEIKFRDGKIIDISNASGHYLPSPSETANYLRAFRKAKVNVDDATLTILGPDGRILRHVHPSSSDRFLFY